MKNGLWVALLVALLANFHESSGFTLRWQRRDRVPHIYGQLTVPSMADATWDTVIANIRETLGLHTDDVIRLKCEYRGEGSEFITNFNASTRPGDEPSLTSWREALAGCYRSDLTQEFDVEVFQTRQET